MQTVQHIGLVSDNDQWLLQQIVNNYAGQPWESICFVLNQIFGNDITTEHYAMLGMLMGEKLATLEMLTKRNLN
jgi:hypothetical protein